MIIWPFLFSDDFYRWLRLAVAAFASLYSTMQVGPGPGNGFLVTSNQFLRPAGSRVEVLGSPTSLAVSPDGSTVAVAVSNTVLLYSAAGSLQRTVPLPGISTYTGLAFSSDGGYIAASNTQGVSLFQTSAGSSITTIPIADPIPCGLAFDPAQPYLYVAMNTKNQVARIDLNQMRVITTVSVGVAPVDLAISPTGDRLFVANWGGRMASPSDSTALSAGTPVVVDARGIAASGTVTAIGLNSFGVLGNVAVGLHPGAIRMRPDGAQLAVANGNSDSVSFIDPVTLAVTETVSIPGFPDNYSGSSPTALAYSQDGSHIYVTCGGNNSVVALAPLQGVYRIQAYAPTDWYPVAVAIGSLGGRSTVFVANAKGVGSRAGSSPYAANARLGTWTEFPAEDMGSSQEVSHLNNIFAGTPVPQGSPANLGDLGIHHVFLIIKENRTYDQVLGDLEVGNGAPLLATYGAQVTPNHHQLARQFVTLDNFYSTGVVSAEGHQWITQAMTTEYIERSYTAGWTRSYPYAGDDPLAFASTGFIWDNALRNGLTVRIFGEFTQPVGSYSHTWTEYLADAQSGRMQYSTPSQSPVAPVNSIIERDFPAFALNVPDSVRARVFLSHFQQYVAANSMPNLVVIWLPVDHTAGTTPGYAVPSSMVADNDLAVGNIIQAISNSPYWPSSAVLVTEDDAQNGVDHVDGHRTLCLLASPYARRRVVDSTSYNQTSLVRTIEDLLGLPPMNKFDAAALPMRSAFVTSPDLTPYTAQPNLTSLAILNPAAGVLKGAERKAALASLKMDFLHPDAAPEGQLNRILWHAAKGWSAPFPKIPHRADCQVDDDDR